MSIKRQISYQYNNLIQAFLSLEVPAWVNSSAIKIALIIIFIFSGSGYIIKTVSSASGGYKIHSLETQVQVLENDIAKLRVEVAENSSLVAINIRLEGMRLIPIQNLSFYDNNQIVAKR